ncbi:MAG TPA: hypothetical protein ENI23_03390 [bacterium]|nr:hypothetical protein [bacterium]
MSYCNNCTVKYNDYHSENIFTWCTNCGNFGVEAATKRALMEEGIKPKDVLMCFDIGCHGNGADKIGGYRFHGLHGRVIPLAAGAALANQDITVFASGGDGGTLSEGINHLVHAIRSDYNFVFLLHNNANYGLTTGQPSATSKKDVPMNSAPDGLSEDTLHVMNFVLSLNPSFAARTFSGDVKHMTKVIREGINHKGFAFIEVFQSCPTYNKETPHEWYQERVYDVSTLKDYKGDNLEKARKIGEDMEENVAIGVLYQDRDRDDFLARQKNRSEFKTELVEEVGKVDISALVKKFT